MKVKRLRIFIVLLAVAALVGTASCSHADLWDSIPQKVENFINQYFPNSELQSVGNTTAGTTVRIDDGPGLTFDADGNWTDINGYGMPLPSVLLYDQLPGPFYNYLQETQNLGSVFQLARKDKIYKARLLNTTVTYNETNGQLTGSTPTSEEG